MRTLSSFTLPVARACSSNFVTTRLCVVLRPQYIIDQWQSKHLFIAFAFRCCARAFGVRVASTFGFDESHIFEMLFELRFIKVAREVGILESIVGGQWLISGTVGIIELLLPFPINNGLSH